MREKKLEEKGNKLMSKKKHLVDVVVKKISEKQKESVTTDEDSLRRSADTEISSIMDDPDGSVFHDQESGTGLTETSENHDQESGTGLAETSEMEDMENRPDFWDQQEAELSEYNEPVDDKILDDDLGLDDEARQTPEGQVNIKDLITNDHGLNVLLTGRPDCGDPGHRCLRGHRREHPGGLQHGVQPLKTDLIEGTRVQCPYQKTEFDLKNVQSPKTHMISNLIFEFFLCNKCIPVKRHFISCGPKELTKTEKIRKRIRKDLLSRLATRAGKKAWTGLLERQEKDLTDKGKTQSRQQRLSRTADRPPSAEEKNSRRRLENPKKKKKEHQQPFQTKPVGTTPAPLFSPPIAQEKPMAVLKRL